MIAGASAAAWQQMPQQLIEGLLSGSYAANGGVITDAAGNMLGLVATTAADGGFGPLAIVSRIGSNIQLYRLSAEVQKVLTYSVATTALAGLGLAVSLGGFVYLARRMGVLEKRLSQIERDTKEIIDILITKIASEFQGALDDYRVASTIHEEHLRQSILLRAQREFGNHAHFFKARMERSSKFIDVVAAEGYFVLAALGHTMCSSDLGMWDESHQALSSHHSDWHDFAKRKTHSLLSLDSPTRLLHRQYVDELPTDTLVKILDFAHDQPRGIEWVDELRRELSDRTMIMAVGRVDRENIEFVKVLRARHETLTGYLGHFEYLAKQRIPVSNFATTISGYLESTQVQG